LLFCRVDLRQGGLSLKYDFLGEFSLTNGLAVAAVLTVFVI